MKPMCYRQHGATLLVSLIFLVLMTLFALTAFNMGKTSLQAVGNMQQRNQTLTAAQEAINDAISSTKFIDTPNAVLSNNSNVMKIDINGDSTNDVEVSIEAPVCIKSRNIGLKELDDKYKRAKKRAETNNTGENSGLTEGDLESRKDEKNIKLYLQAEEEQADCYISNKHDIGIYGDGSENIASPSYCAEGLWEITAVAKDLVSDVTVTVTQGVGVWVPATGNKGIEVVCK